MVNKNLLIPAILAATVLVAGTFAILPVEKVSTIHTSILQRTSNSFVRNNVDNSVATTIVAEGTANAKHGWVCVRVNDAGNDVVTALVNVDIDPATIAAINQVVINNVDAESADGECREFAGVSVILAAGNAGDTADIVAIWSEGA